MNSNSNIFIRVQVRVRVQKNYVFEFKFEFGKITEFFRVQVQIRVRSPAIYIKSSAKQCSISRGGVEDTRLEAKDTKKSEAKVKDSLSENRRSRGQGQECSRPRPRTKDTSASSLQKKKGLHKKFSGDLQKNKK